ncbi:hypothetical protein [Tautonia plasticadhaerens]|uniref:Cthe-2314-like HEPN domain-containing protein n=1 Tax=Tautonia plasticadhaerens TaxID=2527974 RepID=A0A518HD46_9BACT|nr:hypothetical protein [Tautonia plasticadhaerens]QDV38782.1 hypothetical protein ElP_67390 [Tautonia plasticadhaerens]
MAFCQSLQFELPDSFPLEPWETLLDLGRIFKPQQPEAWGDLASAMISVAYRYRSCCEALDSIVDGWDPNLRRGLEYFEAGYRQQRGLFSFFTCGVAAIESGTYACHVYACQRGILDWTDERARRSNSDPLKLARALGAVLPENHPLPVSLKAISASGEWKRWKDFRNTFSHRSVKSRSSTGSIGGTPPARKMFDYGSTWSMPELVGDESVLRVKVEWIEERLRTVLVEGARL